MSHHWTENSPKDFQYRVASDFVTQLESRLELLRWDQSQLARKLNVTEGRVSQIFNNPGNLSLDLMVRCVRSLGMKLAVLAYEDGDPENKRGPINSEIFKVCWQKCSKPQDAWSLKEWEVQQSLKRWVMREPTAPQRVFLSFTRGSGKSHMVQKGLFEHMTQLNAANENSVITSMSNVWKDYAHTSDLLEVEANG